MIFLVMNTGIILLLGFRDYEITHCEEKNVHLYSGVGSKTSFSDTGPLPKKVPPTAADLVCQSSSHTKREDQCLDPS